MVPWEGKSIAYLAGLADAALAWLVHLGAQAVLLRATHAINAAATIIDRACACGGGARLALDAAAVLARNIVINLGAPPVLVVGFGLAVTALHVVLILARSAVWCSVVVVVRLVRSPTRARTWCGACSYLCT